MTESRMTRRTFATESAKTLAAASLGGMAVAGCVPSRAAEKTAVDVPSMAYADLERRAAELFARDVEECRNAVGAAPLWPYEAGRQAFVAYCADSLRRGRRRLGRQVLMSWVAGYPLAPRKREIATFDLSVPGRVFLRMEHAGETWLIELADGDPCSTLHPNAKSRYDIKPPPTVTLADIRRMSETLRSVQ